MTEKAPERFSTYNVMMTAESGKYIPSPDGKWVRFADYATLTAERDALAAEVERLREYYEAREAVAAVGLFYATDTMLRRERDARAALEGKDG